VRGHRFEDKQMSKQVYGIEVKRAHLPRLFSSYMLFTLQPRVYPPILSNMLTPE